MTAPKLTEVQLARLRYLTGEALPTPCTYGDLAELLRRGLIVLDKTNPWGANGQTITDAGRAALRGES